MTMEDELIEQIAELMVRITKLENECRGRAHHMLNCEQFAGKALGYPWFKDDQKNFPGATEEDGVCVGEHIADTIVEELANAYKRVKDERDALRKQVDTLRETMATTEPKEAE
jgi:hypothetical protein